LDLRARAAKKEVMQELTAYIQNFFAVAPSELETIASKFKPLEMEKGDYFLKQGRYCDRLAFITSGLMRISREVDGKEVTQWVSSPGYFVTDLASFVFQSPGRWNIQALTDCTLYSIDRDTYQNLGKEIPKWQELDKLFVAKCFVMLEERIFSHLYMTAEERFQRLLAESPELFNQVPLQYLASMIGMTPETLSRMRNKQLKG
jgi:CRP-like cAMP-binding protein